LKIITVWKHWGLKFHHAKCSYAALEVINQYIYGGKHTVRTDLWEITLFFSRPSFWIRFESVINWAVGSRTNPSGSPHFTIGHQFVSRIFCTPFLLKQRIGILTAANGRLKNVYIYFAVQNFWAEGFNKFKPRGNFFEPFSPLTYF
jgi:hypothetical protein